MHRRQFIKTTAHIAGYLYLFDLLQGCKSSNVHPIRLAPDAPYTMKYLRGHIGYFAERGGTIGWLSSKDGVVVVDAQFPEQARHLITEMSHLHKIPIETLINTHHHYDHTAGNIAFKNIAKQIIAHRNSLTNQQISARQRNVEDAQLYPNVLYDKTFQFYSGKESILLRHIGPAHTSGDTIVHFQNTNVVHMGDLVFNRRYPYIDRPAGANVQNWIEVLDRTLELFDRDTLYIFGHAGKGYDVIGDREDIKAMMAYLENLVQFGQKAIQQGTAIENLIAETKYIKGTESWDPGGLERNIEAIIYELSDHPD